MLFRTGRSFSVRKKVVALAVCAVVVAAGAAEKECFAPRHAAKLTSVGSAAISPDGKNVAYTLSVQRHPLEDQSGSAWRELHVVDQAGKSRPFVTGKQSVGSVMWSADGRSIAFTAKRGDDKHSSLYMIPLTGGEAQKKLSHATGLGGVTFSKDGKSIAFLATTPRPKEKDEWRDKGFNQQIYEEDYRSRKVWIASLENSSSKARALELPGSASLVAWSPDGQYLAVALAPTPLVDDGYMFRRVHVVSARTGQIIERIKNPGKLGQVTWSPDGKHLAMIPSGADIHDPSEGRLMIAAIPGDGTLRDLMPEYEAHVGSFVWKDAKTIMFVADEGTATTVGTVTLDGKQKVQIKAEGPVLSGLTLSRDGRTAAFVGDTPDHPREVFLLDGKAKAPRRLTTGNPWLASVRLARQEVMRWKARDGLDLEGILVYPLDHQEGRRYPLILAVHGGPESHVSNGWVTSYGRPGQMAASRGFAVCYPNYRGSTGRGVAFSKMGQADAAGKEFDDFVDAVDHLVNVGLVAKDKVGITGGSYGGYASAWGATYYSHRFAASVMFVGISDNLSKVGTTDIPEEMYLVHHLKRLWEDWDYFLERSPIRHIQKNKTPTLILHGKDDPRVHPSQSLEFFRHLKTLDQAPVRLVLYPGEGHGNRKSAARFDYSIRLLRWMEHYLQGPGGDAPGYEIDYAKEYKK